jgi:glycosyltransferase involved in cell wall biosynthesis
MFFAEEIFPKILAHDPDCVFHIVGRQPSLEIIALTKYDKIKLTVDLRNIEQAYLDATVGIVPMRFGTGTKLKLLEAFGFGIPCVSTSLGCEGLSVSNQEHLLIADTPDEFAVACIQL